MAVDVQALTNSYADDVRRFRTDALLNFRSIFAEDLKHHPEHRDALLAELKEQRDRLRSEGNEEMEDIILDAMDMLTGWSAHSARL